MSKAAGESTDGRMGLPSNLGDLLHRAVTGDRKVLIDLRIEDEPVAFSADELDQRVRAFARGLNTCGIAPGDRVGLLSENRWEMLVAYLATMYLGAVAVPINHRFPAETIAHIEGDADLDLVFCDGPCRTLVPNGVQAICFDDAARFETFLDPGPLGVYEPGPEDIAEILYTSGSTGFPKGVPLTHRGQLWALGKYLSPPADGAERNLIVAPLYHMNAIVYSSACLLNGVTIIMQPRFDAARYVNAVAKYRCTQLSGVPTMLAMVAALGHRAIPSDLSFVKTIAIGSAPLSDAMLRQIQALFPAAEVSNGYGTTEAGPAVFGPHPEGKPRPPLSIGYPYEDVEWRLTGGDSPEEGVLELRTAALATGYINRPDADKERFRDGWYNTNDIMRRDADGFFYFVSRADDMFVCGGENVYPGEVEKLLNRHPVVQQSFVVGAPDDIKGTVPVAFVVPMRDAEVDEAELRSFTIENGPAYAHPRRIVFKSALPLGGTQKVDRKSLELEAASLMIASGRASGQP